MYETTKLFTDEGKVRRYIGSDIIEDFQPGQVAYVGFPNGYGHGRRVSDIAFTITPRGSLQMTKEKNLRIRKFTPKECWRLMGFSDQDVEKAAAVNSDSQLYKQAGNSIVVDVLMAIFREML